MELHQIGLSDGLDNDRTGFYAYSLESLSGVADQDLNHHLINGHLGNPQVLRNIGLQYDAELASYLGLSLDPTAEVIIDTITAMRTGRFGSTYIYKHMKKLYDSDYFALAGYNAALVQRQLNGIYRYESHLRGELQRLYNLGVAKGDKGPQLVLPKKVDSFFAEFDLA